MLTPEDKDLLVKKGISKQQIAEQLACFEKGFPFLKLDAAASVAKGIMAPAENEMKNYLEAWDIYKEGEKTIVKFVPASGAASRMFKNLFEFLGADYNIPKTDFEKKFFDHIHICAGIWKLSDASQFEKIFENDVVVIAGFDRLDFFELESYLNNVSLINKSRAVLLIPDRLLEVSKPHSENIAVEFETAMHVYSGKLGISYSYYGDDTKHELPKVMASSEYLTDIYSHIIWRESDLDPHDNNLELSAIEMLLLDIEGQESLNFQIWRTRESAEKEEEIKNEE